MLCKNITNIDFALEILLRTLGSRLPIASQEKIVITDIYAPSSILPLLEL
ncbi:MAG: hypothetical protein KDD64_00360 [Bdellovibrionales bacterium]|nr:hypothetical protein [Bdellovibrionales bacterium]